MGGVAATHRDGSFAAAARRVLTSTLTLGTVVFALTWGGGMLEPHSPPSLDHSMHAALNMAVVEGMNFGTDLAFTYGPLGFLKSYMIFYEWPARLAVVYGAGLHLALSLTLVWAIRRNFGAVIAVVLATLIAALARGDELAAAIRDDAGVVILAFTWCVIALREDAPDFTRRLVLFGGGPFAALEILAKPNVGLLVLALVVITGVAMPGERRRNLAIVAATFAGSFAVLWFASGQGVSNFWAFIETGFELSAGYSSNARFEWEPTHGYDYWLTPLLIFVAAGIAWIGSRGLDRNGRAATLLLVTIVGVSGAKNGFVVHDIFHMATSYTILIGVLCVLPTPRSVWPRVGALAGAVAAIGGSMTTWFAFYPLDFGTYPMDNPVANVRDGARTVATMIDEGLLDAQIAANRAHLQEEYALDSETQAALAGRSVHVDPSETRAVWAYGFEWEPLPIFQPYAAWTEALDELNAEALGDPAGPERVLRQNLDALGRYPAFESPAAMLALLCNFEPLHTTPEWQVLGRVANRCGDPRPLATRTATFGTPIPIPEAPTGHVVFALADGLEVTGLERLRSLVFRSQGRHVLFEGDPFAYNFLPGTSGNQLLLAAAPRIDFPGPYRLAPTARSVTFTIEGDGAGREISLDFYALPVSEARSLRQNPPST